LQDRLRNASSMATVAEISSAISNTRLN
jgi:hypothetical protein